MVTFQLIFQSGRAKDLSAPLYLPTHNLCSHRKVFKHYRNFPKTSKANTVEILTFHLPVPKPYNNVSSTYRTEYWCFASSCPWQFLFAVRDNNLLHSTMLDWTFKTRDARRITAAGMKHMRRTAGYTRTDYKIITQIATELKITPILDKLPEYKRNGIQHVNRMPRNISILFIKILLLGIFSVHTPGYKNDLNCSFNQFT